MHYNESTYARTEDLSTLASNGVWTRKVFCTAYRQFAQLRNGTKHDDNIVFRSSYLSLECHIGVSKTSIQLPLEVLCKYSMSGLVTRIVFPYSLTVKKKPSQVEKQMVKSLKEIIEKAVDSYWDQDLLRWILDFPGQVLALIDSPISIRPLLQKRKVKSIFDQTNVYNF